MDPRRAFIQVRLSKLERDALKRAAAAERRVLSDYVREKLFAPADSGASASLANEVGRADLAAIADRVRGLETEVQQAVRFLQELGPAMQTLQKMTASAVASATILRDVSDLPPEKIAAEISRHIRVALAASDEVMRCVDAAASARNQGR